MGIVPNSQSSGNGNRLRAPFWQGVGGIVGRARDGRSVVVRVWCDGTLEEETLDASADGAVVRLLGYPHCVGSGGERLLGELEVEGMEPGGWYWINGDRNAAVAPLMSLDALGGAPPIVPPGVRAEEGPYGTLLIHEDNGLMAVIPRMPAPGDG